MYVKIYYKTIGLNEWCEKKMKFKIIHQEENTLILFLFFSINKICENNWTFFQKEQK